MTPSDMKLVNMCRIFSRLCVYVQTNAFQGRALELEMAEKFDHV